MANKKVISGFSEIPPIVAVLGHVDHGKTTLLDFIRHTNVAASEHGGITQHIGAYQIKIKSPVSAEVSAGRQKSQPKADRPLDEKIKNEEEHVITFIDTPGHEAFMKMRARGASVADIAVLVVAADDGVKPQTKESIRIIKEASIPMIVAVNKIDLPSANVEKIKQDLARLEVQVEGFGGEVPIVLLSAKTGKGVDELLEKIIVLAKALKLPNNPKNPVEAVVIETHVDKGKGMVASVLVKEGTIRTGMALFEDEQQVGSVRALFDEHGIALKEAPPGVPVEVLGFTSLPQIGSILRDVPFQKKTEKVQEEMKNQINAFDFLSQEPQEKTLKIIIKADTAGSLEAIITSLGKGAVIVKSGVGPVNEADILLAKSTGSFIIGFNTKSKHEVIKLAETEGVIVRNYTIIYELLDELTEALSGIQEVLTRERELGKGTIIAEFPYDGKRIAGVKVTEGRLAKGDQVKVMRQDVEVGRAR
ncbi:GTP-binding protein, partial [Patescibacteria group bacterium]|nr:GTP-binding protein [Patescibacteria group bacterium]